MAASILIVENDATSRKLFRVLIEAAGHVAIEATSAEEALSILSQQTPDLVICDLQLGRSMDGYAFSAWCRRQPHLAAIPIFCCSASLHLYDPDKARASGFTTVIPKPILGSAFMVQLEFYLPPEKRRKGAV